MDKKTRDSLSEIVSYLYEDEQTDWEEMDKPANHIFCAINKVMEWLDAVASSHR